MSERKISYISRDFEAYKKSLKEYIVKYYPQIANDFDDASIGSWLVDLVASVADNLSYHIDKSYNETVLDSAEQKNSLYNIARTNGFKVPGPKASMTEIKVTCELPIVTNSKNDPSTIGMPNWFYAPVIKKGSRLNSNNQVFELTEDINFAEAFDANGYADREIIPLRNANGETVKYKISKRETITAGESRIYKQVMNGGSIYPFMEIIIPDDGVMEVESIIFKDGSDFTVNPTYNEFMMEEEFVPAEKSPNRVDTYRYFEVNSLLEQQRWGDRTEFEGNESFPKPIRYTYGYHNDESGTITPTACITRGGWKPLTQKFITEFTDRGYLKITFGSGEQAGQSVDVNAGSDFSKFQLSRMARNNFLGKLPSDGWTMYVRYRVGGGASSNIAAGAINSFSYLDVNIAKSAYLDDEVAIMNAVKSSITVENTIPSVSGKDSPSPEEIKAMIKYHNGAQERCVTIKDYQDRIMQMPTKYGCPFRLNVIEENNKVMIYLLGIDNDGHLTETFPEMLSTNIQEYLSMYRTINDFVEIKSGRVINLSFEIDIYADKNYNIGDVVAEVINTVKEYMKIDNYQLGDDIYISDLEKEVSKVDGVLNLIDMRIFNECGDKYSNTRTTQETIISNNDDTFVAEGDYEQLELDLDASDYILNSDADSMFEIKYPDADIRVRVKTR